MSWRRSGLEALIWGLAHLAARASNQPEQPESILVLRNNDIGDLLVITPLFEALSRRFPAARILAGIGAWNVPVLEGNPHVSEIVPVNAPWHNQQVCTDPAMSPRGLLTAARYILASDEVRRIADLKCDLGIDVLGSPQGSLLLLRSRIPYRLGVKGYAGGHSAAHRAVNFDAHDHVGRAALRFAELLGATDLPENRPQIFLRDEERAAGARYWESFGRRCAARSTRVVVAPGGGFAAKRWPPERFQVLTRLLANEPNLDVVVVGGSAEQEQGETLGRETDRVRNLAGRLALRGTFGVIAAADIVITNSSMAMHVAAAFSKPAVVVLGDMYASARQHAVQWSYKETVVLGKEPGERSELFHPEEVLDEVQRLRHVCSR